MVNSDYHSETVSGRGMESS
jgi:hypothetical protein